MDLATSQRLPDQSIFCFKWNPQIVNCSNLLFDLWMRIPKLLQLRGWVQDLLSFGKPNIDLPSQRLDCAALPQLENIPNLMEYMAVPWGACHALLFHHSCFKKYCLKMPETHHRCDCRHLHRSCHPHWTAAPGDMKLKTNLHACHAYMYTYVYLCTCVCVCVCACVCVYIIYICIYNKICIYKYSCM